MSSLVKALRARGLVSGRGREATALRLCHAGRLVGGLSVSLRATPDELVGPLTHALGGAATRLKVLDVRTSTPPVLEVAWGELHEKWELEGLEALVHNLNSLFAAEPAVKAAAVLGEWEDMLQLWCLDKPTLRWLLDARLLEARNAAELARL